MKVMAKKNKVLRKQKPEKEQDTEVETTEDVPEKGKPVTAPAMHKFKANGKEYEIH